MNCKTHIHFSNGEALKEIETATYLGGEIDKQAGRWNELNNGTNSALVTTCSKLTHNGVK